MAYFSSPSHQGLISQSLQSHRPHAGRGQPAHLPTAFNVALEPPMFDLALSSDVLSLCLLAITIALVAVAGVLASLVSTPRFRRGLHVAALALLFGLAGASLVLGAPSALWIAEVAVVAGCVLLGGLRLAVVRTGAVG